MARSGTAGAEGALPKLLDCLDSDDQRRVIQRCRRVRYPKNAFIFHQEDPADAIYIIDKGLVAIESGGLRTGDTVTLHIHGPGDFFGEMALIGAGHHRSATARTISPTETYLLRKADFDELRRRHGSIEALLTEVLAERVRRLTEQIVELLELPAPTRVMRRLVSMAEMLDVDHDGGQIKITQEQVASLAGLKLRAANRILSEARSRGVLRTSKGCIGIVDWARLRKGAAL